MIFHRLMVIPLALVLSACTSLHTMKPIEEEGQTINYSDGMALISSNKVSSVSLILGHETINSNERRKLFVDVCNNSEEKYVFSTESITAYLEGESVDLIPYDRVVKEIQSQEKWAKFTVAYASANAQAAATMPSTHGGEFNIGRIGSSAPQVQGSYTGKSTNPALTVLAQQAAQSNASERIEEISDKADAALIDAGAAMLKKNTMQPKTCVSGFIVLDKLNLVNNPSTLIFSVNAGNENHIFSFSVARESH